ncbi:MAG: hypothetical protein WBM96_09335, partial [Polyangiales bacterium]
MSKQWIIWSLAFAAVSFLGACGSDTIGNSSAAVQEAINDCHDELAQCDAPTDVCEASAMECMNAVDGEGVREEDIDEDCSALHELCLTKTEDMAFCEDLQQACFDCVSRHGDSDDDSDDDDSDDDDSDSDSDSDDGDSDDDCDDDDDRDDDYDDYDDDDCGHDGGGSGGGGGSAGSGGSAG